MEKRLIILLLIPLLMFFKWFDPIVRENKKGEKAYQNRKYKEALNHFKIARDILSVSDSHKSKVSGIINKLEGMSSYIKKIKAETLNISDLKKKHKKQLDSEFSSLSNGLNRFSDLITDYSEKNSNNDLINLSQKIVENVKYLSKKIVDTFAVNGSGDIGEVYKDIIYTKSQIELYNSKIDTATDGVKATPDLEALRYNIASSFYELGDYKNAKNEFEKINPDKSNIKRSDLFFDLGNTLFKMKNYERALELFKKSLRENPEDIEARQNYELTLEMLKNQKKEDKDKKDKKDNKDKKQDNKDKDRNKEEKKKDKENKDNPKDKKEKQKKKDKQEEKQKKAKKPDTKPEQKHRNMLQFIDQNEKKQMKKMLQKNKLLKYGIKKSKKKRKDW